MDGRTPVHIFVVLTIIKIGRCGTVAGTQMSTEADSLTDFDIDLASLMTNPLKPTAFMPNSIVRSSVPCNKEKPFVKMDGDVFVDELPSPKIEEKIREITQTFVETLKHNKSWFVSLLFHIRKEQKRRESDRCTAAECIYKIPCYLSQRFLAMSAYKKLMRRVGTDEGLDLLRRRRRGLTGAKGLGDADEAEYNSLIADGKAPVMNCTGIYTNYCYNSISCIYVSVLESAACSCMPGYTGLRCDLYDLSITLSTLSQFRATTIDIESLRPEDSATMYSVLDATARYTYTAFTIEEEVTVE
ncbi:unnamed protein product [Mesocestoides corti]|nr:unnamed protein product [Mesocestoides corti]